MRTRMRTGPVCWNEPPSGSHPSDVSAAVSTGDGRLCARFTNARDSNRDWVKGGGGKRGMKRGEGFNGGTGEDSMAQCGKKEVEV